jgi:hypothetical protein
MAISSLDSAEGRVDMGLSVKRSYGLGVAGCFLTRKREMKQKKKAQVRRRKGSAAEYEC